ncbi:MAG: RNA polymerase sigma factor RpoD/SigA [Bacteroidota bacterium]|nr:RNA polymerase sigma factor RpoD/SigA [Bacteroidota bacterium]
MRQLKITRQITNRDTPAFERYLQEIGTLEMVSPQEEIELAKRIKDGDKKALDKLVKANLRFVVSVAKQYQNQGLGLQDLVNEGNVGLIKAAQRFDETRGFKFISYAVWWIRQSILHALAVQGRMIRLPLNRIGTIQKIKSAKNQLAQEFQREPSDEEIAQLMEIGLGDVKEHLSNIAKQLSMDKPMGDEDEDGTLEKVLHSEETEPPDDELMQESLSREINRTLSVLNKREAEILKMFYGLNGYYPHSLEEIGEIYGLSRERVRQLKESCIRRLKQTSRHKNLKAYLK